MGKSSAPPAPDYAAAAQQTAAGNLENLKYQTQTNRPTVNTPWGSQSWSQDGNNNWTQNVSLTPQSQAALNNQQMVQQNQSQLANGLQNRVRDTMATPFAAPDLNSYMAGVPAINTNFGNGFHNNTGGANTGFAGYSAGSAPAVDMNTPQFTDETARNGAHAAYAANTAMIQPQMEQDTKNLDSQLRLQGLTPGSEAYNNAAQNLSRTQGQQLNQIANQSVLSGNQMANQNYASRLAGYGANLGAQGQMFGQGLAANASQQQAMGASNNAQAQNYGQALGGYQTGQAALQNSNAAAQQMQDNQLQKYQTAYQAAFQNYMQPLNAMNSVLTGQQVNSPNFSNTPQTTAGYTGGPDMTGAANATGQYNSGVAAQQAAQGNAFMGAIGNLGGAALGAMKFSDVRLKENIEPLGQTTGGHNLYKYNYKGAPHDSQIGVMAQEAAQKTPGAVVNTPSGFLAVDYSKIK